jgi:hypothetical protein
MYLKKLSVSLVFLVATAIAQAVPVTYNMVIDGVSGFANGAPVGPNASVVIIVNADTSSSVVAGGTGHCVTGINGSISINGGAAQALTGAYYICASAIGDNVGLYPGLIDFAIGNPVHGGNGLAGTGALTGAPAVNLITNLGPVSYVAGSIHSHSAPVSLAGGGTYFAVQPEPGGTAASTFQVALGAAPATPLNSIPTLSEWAMLVLSALLGVAAFVSHRRVRD